VKLKAVIFDFDEVVIYSYRDHTDSYIKAAKNFGLKLKRKHIEGRFGKSAMNILAEAFPHLSKKQIWKLKEEKDKEYRKIISTRKIKVVDGVEKLLKFLKTHKIKRGIASSAAIKNIKIGLKRNRLDKYFQKIVSAESVKRHKPFPDPLLKAAKLLREKPGDCLYIGDSVYEAIAAKRAKMPCFGMTTGYYSASQLRRGGMKKVFRNHIEIKNYLAKILKE
jgi:HAD superfamily hydrolase (TIGR01549 family)